MGKEKAAEKAAFFIYGADWVPSINVPAPVTRKAQKTSR